MSENLLKLFGGPIETREGAERHALRLYLEIEKHHGEQEARRIFARRGRRPTKREAAEWREFKLLDRYDNMQPKPNVMQLARELEAESKTLPADELLTARGNTTASTAVHYINQLRKRRDRKIAEGSWGGPPWNWGVAFET